jgi:hypothetical protein
VVSVLPGDGAGGLGTPAHHDVGAFHSGLSVGDLDEDGAPDIVVTRGDQKLGVLLSEPGGFAPVAAYELAAGARMVPFTAIADVDGDGHRDVVAPHPSLGTVLLFLGDGTGALATPISIVVGGLADGVVVADVLGDARADIAVALPGFDVIAVVERTD